MSLKFSVVPRKVLAGEHVGETRYYGQVKSGNRISFKDLCARIALQSSATRGDVELILDGLITSLTEYLNSGSIIQVGELGNFRMTAGSSGTEKAEEFSGHLMRNAKVVFTPGEALRRTAREMKYEKENPKVVEVICEETHA